MAVTVKQFLDLLRRSGLWEADRIGELETDLLPVGASESAEALADRLVREGRLTAYQAAKLCRGESAGLLYGHYEVLDEIGGGGMGQVFKARHRLMNRVVALKTLPPAVVSSRAAIKRFQREVEAAATLEHPHVVTAYDAGKADGVHFFVMQYVEGTDLANLVKQIGPLSVDAAVNVILQAARGLEYAHGKGVFHRDIKPSNLLLDRNGTVKILDLGLARIRAPEAADGDATAEAQLTQTGTVMGTADYMAPEQAEDARRADHRADIYSLGCTLHYLLTGQVVYGGDTLVQKLIAHREHHVPSLQQSRPDIPDWVDGTFRRLVAKQPEDRFESTTDLIAELECHGATGKVAVAAGDFVVHRGVDVGIDETAIFRETARATGDDRADVTQIRSESRGGHRDRGHRRRLVLAGIAAGGVAMLLALAALVFYLGFPPGDLSDPERSGVAGAEDGSRAAGKRLELADLVERIEPAVVRIDVKRQDGSALGSGFVVDKRGWVVTNFHVMQGALEAIVRFRDDTQSEVQGVLAADIATDLVVLQLAAPPPQLPVAPLAAQLPRKGDAAAAFGAPQGFSFSATEGIISAIRTGREIREILMSVAGVHRYGQPGYDAETQWIQTTAPISRGNSGGPLVNMKGEVVGVNTWVHAGGQSLNFAASPLAVADLLVAATGPVRPLGSLDELVPADGLQPPSVIGPELPDHVTGENEPGEVYRFEQHTGAVRDVAVSPDGRYLATAGSDGKACLVELKTLEVVYRLESTESEFLCVCFSRDGRRLLTGNGAGEAEDRNLRFWDRPTGDLLVRIVGRAKGTLSIAVSADGRSLASTHDAGIADLRLLDRPADSFPLVAHDRSRPCWDATFSPDSRFLLTAGGDGKLFVWQIEDRPVGYSRMQAHPDEVRAVAFSPDGKQIVSAGNDGSIRVWTNWHVQDDWRLAKKITGHEGHVTSLDFAPHGSLLVSGGADKTVRIWDSVSGQAVHTYTGHTDGVTSVKFLRSGRFVASASTDTTVRFWCVPRLD